MAARVIIVLAGSSKRDAARSRQLTDMVAPSPLEGDLVLLSTPPLAPETSPFSARPHIDPYPGSPLCDGRRCSVPPSLISFPARTRTAEWTDVDLSRRAVAALASRRKLEGGVRWKCTIREGGPGAPGGYHNVSFVCLCRSDCGISSFAVRLRKFIKWPRHPGSPCQS